MLDIRSTIAMVYALKEGHLTVDQAAFFNKWEAMIALEKRKGKCFADMTLDGSFRSLSATCGSHAGGTREGEGIYTFGHRFVRVWESAAQTRQAQEEAGSSSSPSLLSGHTNAGDTVTVSVDTVMGVREPRLLTLAQGDSCWG